VAGPIAGGAVFVILQQYLSEYVGFNLIILGTITILVIFFAPKGIVGEFQEKFDFEVFPIRRQ
jgi:branched-chain amino acid transport system permease protein